MIALDCDGTLFYRHSEISEEGKTLLKQLKENGTIIVLNSGRPLYSIRHNVPESLYDYAVSENGALIYNADTKIRTESSPLTKEDTDYLIKYLETERVMIVLSSKGSSQYVYSKKHHITRKLIPTLKNIAHRSFKNRIHLDTKIDESRLQNIHKICYSGLPHTLKKIQKETKENGYEAVLVSPVWLEVMPFGISKGKALEAIMAIENIDRADVIAIGDGENDIAMIEAAGIGVAMKNAMASVRKHADFIAPSVNEDGAVKWLKEYLSI